MPRLKRKWKISLAIWLGIILYFGVGSVYAQEADLVLVGVRVVLLLAVSVYILVIWLRDLGRGETDKQHYHLSAYPKPVLKFLFDEPNTGKNQSEKKRSTG